MLLLCYYRQNKRKGSRPEKKEKDKSVVETNLSRKRTSSQTRRKKDILGRRSDNDVTTDKGTNGKERLG